MIGRVVSRHQYFEIILANRASLRDAHRAIGRLMRLDCLPLDVIARVSGRHEVNWAGLSAAARSRIIEAAIRRSSSRLKQVNFLNTINAR